MLIRQTKKDSHNNPKEPFGEKMKLIWAEQKNSQKSGKSRSISNEGENKIDTFEI